MLKRELDESGNCGQMDRFAINMMVKSGKVYEMEWLKNGRNLCTYIQDGRGPLTVDEALKVIKEAEMDKKGGGEHYDKSGDREQIHDVGTKADRDSSAEQHRQQSGT